MNQTLLPFFDFSDDSRLKFAQLVDEKPLSDRAKKFLRFAYDVASEHSRAGMRVRYYRRALIVSCLQERLAELLDNCSVKTVQRMFDELEECGVVSRRKVTPKTDGPPIQKTCYVVLLEELEALPSLDPTDELDCVILECDGDLRGVGEVNVTHPELDVASVVVCPVVSVVASDVASLMSMKHEHAKTHEIKTHESCSMSMPHELLRNSSENKTQESQVSEVKSQSGPAVSKRVRFSCISREDATAIVRRNDVALFLAFFRDAAAAGWAKDCQTDRIKMAALFHQVVRIGEAKSPGAVINRSWATRDDPDEEKRLKLAGEDEEFARQLLRPSPMVQRQPSMDEDPEAADRREERARKQIQLAAIAKFASERRPP